MKKLIAGIIDFRRNVRPQVKDAFAKLALGQRPDALLIACSDSRVVPNLFASSDPGDLFVVRNVGNLIPPFSGPGGSGNDSESAAIEFALQSLPIADIIVCGHSECGAMDAMMRGRSQIESVALKNWLRHADDSLRKLEQHASQGSKLPRHNQLSQQNVLSQIEHLKTYPLIRERLKDGRLTLHGWWFDIKEAEVFEYSADENAFQLIDEDYARALLTQTAGRT